MKSHLPWRAVGGSDRNFHWFFPIGIADGDVLADGSGDGAFQLIFHFRDNISNRNGSYEKIQFLNVEYSFFISIFSIKTKYENTYCVNFIGNVHSFSFSGIVLSGTFFLVLCFCVNFLYSEKVVCIVSMSWRRKIPSSHEKIDCMRVTFLIGKMSFEVRII